MAAIWCYRFPISYKLTNVTYHALIVDHDLTQAERDGIGKAYQIRKNISTIFQVFSFVVWIGCFLLLRAQKIAPRWLARIIIYLAATAAIILTLADGIGFIPGPPIR
ncbi:hypothetical protein HHL16_11425 [Pseudoflavitalea sp. G-6-1-2]|uniref:hypothetical protein n=1 Tax=Pseudoflavitalea sp. G-6-1-2 TaxID=2728841 RepID=UPI00146A409B|nr:hypothetical protein [Pseudoflavitalea sp. G-6-1-2]NML21489.1 hypothetical protein [Pseudoflavitalea sp. G-6-1-2]